MSTEFISLLAPPGPSISNYARHLPADQQPDHVPPTFREAMSIRSAVFVTEQHVPLENELDADDPRCWHWVTYASIGSNAPMDPRAKRGSTASRLAVGTIRLVPPPHPPHPAPGSHHGIDGSEPGESDGLVGGQSSQNPRNEPYVKLGRLAVLSEFRRLGLAKLLVDSVLGWAASHAEEILPPPSAMDREAARIDGAEGGGKEERWKGLVLVHAQKSVEKWWAKRGFVRDEGLGEWVEEGIAHVGMWRRIAVREK